MQLRKLVCPVFGSGNKLTQIQQRADVVSKWEIAVDDRVHCMGGSQGWVEKYERSCYVVDMMYMPDV